MRRLRLLLLGLMTSFLVACSVNPDILSDKPFSYFPDHNSGHAEANLGDAFKIQLGMTMGTGYSWVAENVPSPVEIDSILAYDYSDQMDKAGGSGYTLIKGKVTKAGDYTFTLTYKQDWEGGNADGTRYQVDIRASDSSIQKLTLTELKTSSDQ